MSQIYEVDKDQGQQRRQDDSRIRLSVARNIPEWDEEWGGDCPWRKPDPEFEELRRRAGLLPKEDALKRSSVDTFWIPLILIIGFLAFLFGLYYILDLFMFTFLPWWFA